MEATLTDTEFDEAYQELLAAHDTGDCPEECAFCEEDRLPLVVELSTKRVPFPATTYGKTGVKTGQVVDYRLTFGKHKGKVLSQVPLQYLDWILSLDASGKPKDEWIRQAQAAVRRYLNVTPTQYERHEDRKATRKAKRKHKKAIKEGNRNRATQERMARQNAGLFTRHSGLDCRNAGDLAQPEGAALQTEPRAMSTKAEPKL